MAKELVFKRYISLYIVIKTDWLLPVQYDLFVHCNLNPI